jgi:hypothetical protein
LQIDKFSYAHKVERGREREMGEREMGMGEMEGGIEGEEEGEESPQWSQV